MPLRDHFRPPLDDLHDWAGLYGGWPAMMVAGLSEALPRRYVAYPLVRPGPSPSYQMQVFDVADGRRLVASVEFVSPANKGPSQGRTNFVARCAALLSQRVGVVIVDLVMTCERNLYAELLEQIGCAGPGLSPAPPLYAAALRTARRDDSETLEAWPHPLALGQPLPTVPLWLADGLAMPLELEASYEETCRILRIP